MQDRCSHTRTPTPARTHTHTHHTSHPHAYTCAVAVDCNSCWGVVRVWRKPEHRGVSYWKFNCSYPICTTVIVAGVKNIVYGYKWSQTISTTSSLFKKSGNSEALFLLFYSLFVIHFKNNETHLPITGNSLKWQDIFSLFNLQNYVWFHILLGGISWCNFLFLSNT